jgi:hypothetical protein
MYRAFWRRSLRFRNYTRCADADPLDDRIDRCGHGSGEHDGRLNSFPLIAATLSAVIVVGVLSGGRRRFSAVLLAGASASRSS